MKTLSIKGIFFFYMFSVASMTLFSQKNSRLIVRSDDMGGFHSVNVACIDAYENGIQTVEEVMPVAVRFTEAVRMLNKLGGGKNYVFVDQPALDNHGMESVGHVAYEQVAEDRQGITDVLTSEKVKQTIKVKRIELITYNDITKSLPRSTPEAEKISAKGIEDYLDAVKKSGQDLHSLMILRHGKVVTEHWLGDHAADKPHIMNSVSKTFTATAIGFAVLEGKLKLTDKVISFFPDKLPASVSQDLKELDIKHLLTMSVGHDPSAVREKTRNNDDWVATFLAEPVTEKPGTQFNYNSVATYMLSAIMQKVSGEKLINYLYPRLFRPLGIEGATWEECPRGVNIGGWGLYIKTEDMAKLGQFFLQKGKWNGVQLLPESWIEEATSSHIASLPAGAKREELKIKPENSDWLQGYGYQIWRCRHNGYRAGGAYGQFIIVLPEKDVVIVTTAHIDNMQEELNLIWEYLLPAIK